MKQDFKVGILQGRTVDMKTLTLIEEPTEEVKKHNSFKTLYKICFQVLAEAEDEFERLLNEAE